DVEGTSRKRRKRKKHKEHRRDIGALKDMAQAKEVVKIKLSLFVCRRDEESPGKRKKRKRHKAHRVTEDGPVFAGAPIIPIECIDPATVWHPSMKTSLLIHGLRGSPLFGREIVTVVLLRS
ncbi:unnamed protein product, partial [Porites lobata]